MERLNMASYFVAQGYGKEQLKYIQNPPQQNDKWLLQDIKLAINLIKKASKIAIIGDYDFDGISATTIIVKTLEKINKDTVFFIPNRFKDGYGLNVNLVQKAFQCGADTILTVDNGIAAYDAIQSAKDLGLTVIVSDHHSINKIPPADAIVHPALGSYPFASISGCQVVYKLAMALFEDYDIHDSYLEEYFLQLSAMSIVSDVMPIASKNMKYNENRLWLQNGIQSLNDNPHVQFKSLMKRFGFSLIDETVLGFYIIPCINAIGRLSDATFAVKYFLSEQGAQLEKMADKIIICNEKRKELVDKQMKYYKPRYSPKKKAVFTIGDEIHEGIAGLIAGKYSSGKGTVSFCFTKIEKPNGDVFYKGSGRNDTDLSLMDILNHLPEGIMIGYGGHKDACGLSVRVDQMAKFIRLVSKYVDDKAHPNKPYIIDIKEGQLNQISSFVKVFKPFGNGFISPIIKMNILTDNIMTTKSGPVKITGTNSNILFDLWLREADVSLYNHLDTVSSRKQHPSGAVTYYNNINMQVITEVDYTPKKNQNEYSISYNAIEAKVV